MSSSRKFCGIVASRICGCTPRSAAVAGIDALTGLQPHHHAQPPVRAAIERALLAADERLRAERDRDVERPADVDAKESRRRDADDRVGDALDRQRLADDVRRARVARLPVAVADDRDRPVGSAAAAVVRVGERAAENRRHAEHVEEAAARPHAVDVLGLADCDRLNRPDDHAKAPSKSCWRSRICSQIGLVHESRAALAPVPRTARCCGLLDGQRAKHQAVEDGEDRRVGPNAERERQDRDNDCHDGRGLQRAERVSSDRS